MLRGELYLADDPELAADHARAQALLERYNATSHEDEDGASAAPARAPRGASGTASS